MNVQELYDHIIKHMTPEEALMKFLEGHLITYNKLKFDQGDEIHLIMLISMAAMDLGWMIGVEKKEGDVEGVMVGTKEYMNRNTKSQ